VIEQ
jgi:hypothetical protein